MPTFISAANVLLGAIHRDIAEGGSKLRPVLNTFGIWRGGGGGGATDILQTLLRRRLLRLRVQVEFEVQVLPPFLLLWGRRQPLDTLLDFLLHLLLGQRGNPFLNTL